MKSFSSKYTVLLYLLAIIGTHTAFAMEKQATVALEKQMPTVLSFYRLYKGSNYSTRYVLYIDKEELPDSYTDLKTFFENNHLLPHSNEKWKDKEWKKAYTDFVLLAQKGIITNKMIKLQELPPLLEDAKFIVKSFLLADDNELPLITNEFMPKPLADNLNRLFTYAFLDLVIRVRKLTHLKLPRKVLLIQDKETKRYVSGKEAEKIIDENLKIYMDPPWNLWDPEVTFAILFNSDKYDLKFFAHKESKERRGLSSSAFSDLTNLCKEAPFDIGVDNIFWNAKGDGIIIDTEFHGEPSTDACPKLRRYPVDLSL